MAEHSAGFKIYADSSQFERGMANVTRTASEVGKKVANAFDGRAIGRTLATAFGLSLTDIADKVARFWTGFSKDAEAALEAMVAATGKAADAQERALEKLRAKKEKEADEASDRATKEYELIRDFRRKSMEEDAAAAAKQSALKEEVAAKEAAVTLEKKAQEQLTKEQIRLAGHEEQLAGERAEAEKKVTAELERQASYRTAGIAGVRGNSVFGEASNAALQEQMSRNQQAIAGMGQFLNIGQQMEVARLQAEIMNIKQELDFRSELSRNVGSRGVEGARSLFQGDPLAYDRLVQQYVQDSRDAKEIAASTNELIRQMNERQKSGLPVVNLNL